MWFDVFTAQTQRDQKRRENCTRALGYQFCQRTQIKCSVLEQQEKHTSPAKTWKLQSKPSLRMAFEATSQSIYYWNFCEDARVQSRSLLQESILGDGAFEPRRPVAFTGQILHNSLFLGKLDSVGRKSLEWYLFTFLKDSAFINVLLVMLNWTIKKILCT